MPGPCLHRVELPLPGMLLRALGVDTKGAAMGPVSPLSHVFLQQPRQQQQLPPGKLLMSATALLSFPAGLLGSSHSWEHLYLL